jgi:hypothetical protein
MSDSAGNAKKGTVIPSKWPSLRPARRGSASLSRRCERSQASQAAALSRSKRCAKRSRSGPPLSRVGRWIVPPFHRRRLFQRGDADS